jgi:hypothetical protein
MDANYAVDAIIVRSLTDEKFRKELCQNPKAVITRELSGSTAGADRGAEAGARAIQNLIELFGKVKAEGSPAEFRGALTETARAKYDNAGVGPMWPPYQFVYVVAYEDSDEKCSGQIFFDGNWRADYGQFDHVGNDSISSYRVSDLAQGYMQANEPDRTTPSHPQQTRNFGPSEKGDFRNDSFNDKCSFIHVEYPQRALSNGVYVEVYENKQFTGARQFFGPGTYRANRGELSWAGNWNDRISSVIVGPHARVILGENEPEHAGGIGMRREYGPNSKASFEHDAFNDRCSYIEVHPA